MPAYLLMYLGVVPLEWSAPQALQRLFVDLYYYQEVTLIILYHIIPILLLLNVLCKGAEQHRLCNPVGAFGLVTVTDCNYAGRGRFKSMGLAVPSHNFKACDALMFKQQRNATASFGSIRLRSWNTILPLLCRRTPVYLLLPGGSRFLRIPSKAALFLRNAQRPARVGYLGGRLPWHQTL